MPEPDITRLKSSWTKYDSVKVIEITIAGDLEKAIEERDWVDEPVLRHFLGVDSLDDDIPSFWTEIQKHPKQIGVFALIAAIFTHHDVIDWFAHNFSQGNMGGVFLMKEGDKNYTNLRSALVVSKAADAIFRRKKEVPYDLSTLFVSGEVGILAKELLSNRMNTIGYSYEDIRDRFCEIAVQLEFPAVLSLSHEQFREWTNGKGVSDSLFELEKNNITYEKYGRIRAIRVTQWLTEWDRVPNYDVKNRRKPESCFYQFSIPALLLKRIYDVHSRRANAGRLEEPYSQRKYSEERSNEIREFVKGGFPWSTISRDQRNSETYNNLQMPGWLPTAIIANILNPGSERRQRQIEDDCVIQVIDIDDQFADIVLPEKIWSENWTPMVSPVEIIDGQHRIKAFDYIKEINGAYEFPINAFHNLDFTWQAYLFYTINIKPKRINTSLAYDLMPLLRIQDWLEQDLSGPDIYRKVRAQELTELLWSSTNSPWNNRINMLGGTGDSKGGPVSQNAFINSLVASFVKRWEGRVGGLFGGEMHQGEQDVIQWDKETQAAYLIAIWKAVVKAVGGSEAEWVSDLKSTRDKNEEKALDLATAFTHTNSFFTTDQGVRGVLNIFNDMSFEAHEVLGLNKFFADISDEEYTTDQIIRITTESFRNDEVIWPFLLSIAEEIVNNFDWRTPAAFDAAIPAQDAKRQHQNQFRGSGGYREMRMQLLRILVSSAVEVSIKDGTIKISDIATSVQTKLGL
jgi:DGQHR domain-containing protein